MAVKVVGDRAVGDVLVDKEEVVAPARGAAEEGDEVGVAKGGQDLHLVHK